MVVLSYIIEDSTLIETTVFSSQVAEQGLISSIRQLTIPRITAILI